MERIWITVGSLLGGITLTTFVFAVLGNEAAGTTLPKMASLGEIVTAFSILFAAFTYRLQMKQDRELKTQRDAASVADQIRMFRTEVLDSTNRVIRRIDAIYKDKGQKVPARYMQPIFPIEEFTRTELQHRNPAAYAAQERMLRDLGSDWSIVISDVVNTVEELSIRIKLHDTMKMPELDCIKKSYVEIVEQFAVGLVAVSRSDPNMFSATKEIYREWSDDSVTQLRHQPSY